VLDGVPKIPPAQCQCHNNESYITEQSRRILFFFYLFLFYFILLFVYLGAQPRSSGNMYLFIIIYMWSSQRGRQKCVEATRWDKIIKWSSVIFSLVLSCILRWATPIVRPLFSVVFSLVNWRTISASTFPQPEVKISAPILHSTYVALKQLTPSTHYCLRKSVSDILALISVHTSWAGTAWGGGGSEKTLFQPNTPDLLLVLPFQVPIYRCVLLPRSSVFKSG